jgi:hypothetical protein
MHDKIPRIYYALHIRIAGQIVFIIPELFNVFKQDIHTLNFLLKCTCYLRNKSWKPECVGSFNMDWWILVFYPEPEARDKIY